MRDEKESPIKVSRDEMMLAPGSFLGVLPAAVMCKALGLPYEPRVWWQPIEDEE